MLTTIEEKGLKEAGFKDDEILELSSIKDAMEKADANIERALSVAMTGLLYFIGTPVDIKVDGIEVNGVTGGYRITGVSKKGTHAPVALVIIDDKEEPVEIQYGIRLNEDEPCSVKILERCRFDGNTDLFVPCCLTYLSLSGYSFFVRKDDSDIETGRNNLLVGDSVSGIIQRPVGGEIDYLNIVNVKNIAEEVQLTEGVS